MSFQTHRYSYMSRAAIVLTLRLSLSLLPQTWIKSISCGPNGVLLNATYQNSEVHGIMQHGDNVPTCILTDL